MIERSHGKARPTLPRSSDLGDVEAVREPSAGRTAGGRFGPGNRAGVGHGWVASVKKVLGKSAADSEIGAVSRDAMRLYLQGMRELPHDGAHVRSLVALQARHLALAAFFAEQAVTLGLSTEAGQAADDRSMRHGQRAERLVVTALDVSTRLATARPRVANRPPVDIKALVAAASARAAAAEPKRADDEDDDEDEEVTP